MAVNRVSNRKTYSFKSSGKSRELAKKLVRDGPELPPVGIKTPARLSETGKNFLEMNNKIPFQNLLPFHWIVFQVGPE